MTDADLIRGITRIEVLLEDLKETAEILRNRSHDFKNVQQSLTAIGELIQRTRKEIKDEIARLGDQIHADGIKQVEVVQDVLGAEFHELSKQVAAVGESDARAIKFRDAWAEKTLGWKVALVGGVVTLLLAVMDDLRRLVHQVIK